MACGRGPAACRRERALNERSFATSVYELVGEDAFFEIVFLGAITMSITIRTRQNSRGIGEEFSGISRRILGEFSENSWEKTREKDNSRRILGKGREKKRRRNEKHLREQTF